MLLRPGLPYTDNDSLPVCTQHAAMHGYCGLMFESDWMRRLAVESDWSGRFGGFGGCLAVQASSWITYRAGFS